MSRARDVIRSGVRTVGARWPSGGSGIPSMASSMTRGKSSNAVPIPPARHEPALEAREMGRKSAQRALCAFERFSHCRIEILDKGQYLRLQLLDRGETGTFEQLAHQ